MLADVGYTGTITNTSGNVLGDRAGFVGHNMLRPGYEKTTISLGDALAGKTVRIRFRLGTDAASGGDGWDIDEVSFSGIDGKPFPAQVADGGTCTPNDAIVSGGGGCSTSSGASPWLLALALVWLRRRPVSRSRARPSG
jgi:MYXO-CTERM domain-containing protein